MFGQTTNPLAAYQKIETDVSVDTASPHQLIVMLYDGAISAISVARQRMLENNLEAKGLAISKAIDIVSNGLKVSLDLEAGGEIAQNLAALYDYMVRRLVHANLKNQVAALDEVAGLLGDIRSAWVEIKKSLDAPNETQP